MRHIVKKRVTGLSFTTGLVIRISHNEEEAPRSPKPSINSVSPGWVRFIGGSKGKQIYVTDLCHVVTQRIFSNKNKYFPPQTTSKARVRLSDDACPFIPDSEIHIITNHYIMSLCKQTKVYSYCTLVLKKEGDFLLLCKLSLGAL